MLEGAVLARCEPGAALGVEGVARQEQKGERERPGAPCSPCPPVASTVAAGARPRDHCRSRGDRHCLAHYCASTINANMGTHITLSARPGVPFSKAEQHPAPLWTPITQQRSRHIPEAPCCRLKGIPRGSVPCP